MTSVTTRRARAEDSELAYRIKKAALGPYVARTWGWDEEEQRALHARRFAAQDVEIVQHEGRDVGLMARARGREEILLHQLFLLPEHQGKGIGTICMRRLMDEARAAGVAIRLQVLKINVRATAFYERLGFTRDGESETHVWMTWRA